MLNDLMDRGFTYEEGLLCVSDGSRGISAAIRNVFQDTAAHERCRLHKIRNVVEHVTEKHRHDIRMKMWEAYNTHNFEEVKQKLQQLAFELSHINPSAAASLREGMDETLTLQRLGLNMRFGKGFGTTNCIESINSQLEHRTRKVTNWQEGNMRQRWVAQSLLKIEPTLRKVAHFRHLPDFTAAFEQINNDQ